MNSTPLDPRAESALAWACSQLSVADPHFAPASADASFRRYFRLSKGTQSWIVMDAPPEKENSAPFIQVAQLMAEAGLHVPRVIAQNLEHGFLLLSDLGRQTYLNVINDTNADKLFSDAIAALIQWQCASRKNVLPYYDESLLKRELALFPDWYVGQHLKRSLSPARAGEIAEINKYLVARALAQPQVYVHRDYMPRNLMISTPNPGVLDFQDAVYGPITYDVVSLFKDAFISWPEERIRGWVREYWDKAQRARLPVGRSFAEFYTDMELMGVQRHLKVIGIFARINYRDGKPHYLKDVPRFITYVRDVAARHPELDQLLKLFDVLEMLA